MTLAATGLIEQIPEAEISVLCTIDSETLQETTYNFMRADESGKAALRARVLTAFKDAEILCAYNAVLFDIPFMQKQLDLPTDVVEEWLRKLCDPFHAIKTCFQTTCKLDKMLRLNGLECKSATGLQAIVMARNGDWDALVDYCMDDVRLTAQLCTLPTIYLFQHMDGFYVCCSFTGGVSFRCSGTPPGEAAAARLALGTERV